MQSSSEAELRAQAHKRVDFKIHFFVYCVINAALWILWALTWRGYPWPVWPMVGWGVGLLFHYMFNYRSSKFFSEEAEYKKLKEESN